MNWDHISWGAPAASQTTKPTCCPPVTRTVTTPSSSFEIGFVWGGGFFCVTVLVLPERGESDLSCLWQTLAQHRMPRNLCVFSSSALRCAKPLPSPHKAFRQLWGLINRLVQHIISKTLSKLWRNMQCQLQPCVDGWKWKNWCKSNMKHTPLKSTVKLRLFCTRQPQTSTHHQGNKRSPFLTVRLLTIYWSHSLNKFTVKTSLFYSLIWETFTYLLHFLMYGQALLEGALWESRRKLQLQPAAQEASSAAKPNQSSGRLRFPALL